MHKSYYDYPSNCYGSATSAAAMANGYGANPGMMCGGPGGGYDGVYSTTPPPQGGPTSGHSGPGAAAVDAYRASCLMSGNVSNGHHNPGPGMGLNYHDQMEAHQQHVMGQLQEGMYGNLGSSGPLGPHHGSMHPQAGLMDPMNWGKLGYGDPNNPAMGMEPGNGNCGPGALPPGHPATMHPGSSPHSIQGETGSTGCGGDQGVYPWMKEKRHNTKQRQPSVTTLAVNNTGKCLE